MLIFRPADTEPVQLQDDRQDLSKREEEVRALLSEIDLLTSDLALRKELTSDLQAQVQNLEKKVDAAEEEARCAANKLNNVLKEKNSFSDQVHKRTIYSESRNRIYC